MYRAEPHSVVMSFFPGFQVDRLQGRPDERQGCFGERGLVVSQSTLQFHVGCASAYFPICDETLRGSGSE